MFENIVLTDVVTWFIIPNMIAQIFITFNKAYYANVICVFGYLCMLYHNLEINDPSQIFYFMYFEVASIIGVILYYYKFRKSKV